MPFEVVFAEENGTVGEFEDFLITKAEQEARLGRRSGRWIRLAELYYTQKERLALYPWAEEFNKNTPEDESPPVVKHVTRNTDFEFLFRWGIFGGITGNHRILYTVHNYHKVVLLHYFDKRYNGDIKRSDIIPAEETYSEYCSHDPSHYNVMKG
jgi:hypothetical protein